MMDEMRENSGLSMWRSHLRTLGADIVPISALKMRAWTSVDQGGGEHGEKAPSPCCDDFVHGLSTGRFIPLPIRSRITRKIKRHFAEICRDEGHEGDEDIRRLDLTENELDGIEQHCGDGGGVWSGSSCCYGGNALHVY